MTDSDLTVSGAGDLSAVSVWEMDNSTLTFLDGADLDFTDDELIADHIDFTNGKVTLFSAEDEITGFSDFAKVSLNENLLEYNSEANIWSFGAGVHTIRIELSDDRKSILASGIAIA